MGVFVVIPLQESPPLLKKLEEYQRKSMALQTGEWLVAFDGTSKQLCDDLGISASDGPSAIVVAMTAFWGRADPSVWEFVSLYGGHHGGQ